MNLPSSQKQASGNLIWSLNETIKVSQPRGVNPIYVVENLEIKTLNLKENSKSSIQTLNFEHIQFSVMISLFLGSRICN